MGTTTNTTYTDGGLVAGTYYYRVTAGDTAGTMQAAVKVPNGSGQANYTDFANPHRAGDLSGINVDPVDGSFWAANEFANSQATANWGTAVANFQARSPVAALTA